MKKPLIWKTFRAIVFLASVLAFALPGAASEDKLSEPGWLVDYIDRVPPILMKEPFLELLGQAHQPVPYN